MLDILKYIFSSVWIFLGSIILLYVVGEVMTNIVANICKTIVGCKGVKNNKNNDIKIE